MGATWAVLRGQAPIALFRDRQLAEIQATVERSRNLAKGIDGEITVRYWSFGRLRGVRYR